MIPLNRQRLLAALSLVLLGAAAISMGLPPQSILVSTVASSGVLAAWGLTHPGLGAAVAVVVAAICSVSLTGLPWQAVMPVAVLLFAVAAKLSPKLGVVREPVGRVPAWGTLVCAAVTPVALFLWLRLTHPDISDLVKSVPQTTLPLLVLGGAAFALVNAFFEELIWRGIFQTRLVQLFGAPLAIGTQAVSFGVAHAHGFPRGFVGVLLAGVWGAMLGALRQQAGGLLAPVLAHVVADSTIAYLI